MDWNPETLQFLSQSFVDTLSPQPGLRRRGLENLAAAADTPNYGLAVLRLVAEPSVDEQTRECAAVGFKNHIKTRWVSSSANSIPCGEKEQIKTLIVPRMLSATGKIQAELSEAIAVIANHDFRGFCTALLPDLKSRLETAMNGNDFASVNGILATFNSLFKRFRCESSGLYDRIRREGCCTLKRLRSEFKSNTLLLDLKYCSENLASQLLSTVESISRRINDDVCVETLRQLLEARRLCCRIFYSLNYFCVAEEIRDKEDEWMDEFKNYLTESYPDIEVVDEVRTAVCENISHYMEKMQEDFQKHLSDFVEAVWSVVGVASASERLTVTGIKFLSKSVEYSGGDEIFKRIVIPNVMLRDEDEELFKKNYLEFIRRDMERNDLNIRRRNACEILKGSKNKEKIRAQIEKCLALFDENPGANWKYKDCAIHMVVSLASGGGSGTNDVVDVESFFKSVIVPELQQEEDVNAFPMLKAAALKFFTVLRVMIPKHVAMPLLGDVVCYVGSDWRVVQSYAAICIEKLLLVKDDIINGGGGGGVQIQLQARRYTSTDIHPIHEDLLDKLFGALGNKPPYGEHNHYIMRCMMRVVEIADDMSLRCLSNCFTGLTMALSSAMTCKTLKDVPEYYHFLFEAVAGVVRRGCETGCRTRFETRIIYQFNNRWARSYVYPQLFPYFLQLLAQLVDIKKQPATYPGVLVSIIDGICLVPDFKKYWERPANVAILVGLLQSFLQDAPDEVNREGRLRRLLVVGGTINKLVSSPTQEEGFRLLNTVIENCEYGAIAEYMNQIWASLFALLEENKTTPTTRVVRCVMVFMSLFLVKHGVQTLMELVGVNVFHDVILREFWIPNLKNTMTGGYNNNYTTEVKLCAVASTKLLCESVLLLDSAAEELWGKLLDATVTLLSLPLPDKEREMDDEEPDLTGYRLRNAVGKNQEEDWDPLKEIEDPKHFLVDFPAKVWDKFRGKFPEFSMVYLSPPNQAALVNLCTSYNIAIV